MNMAKVFGTTILTLAIILVSCNPSVSNLQMRRGVKADGTVGSGGPPVTNQTLTAPTGVTTAVLPTGRIRISWNAVPGATSYRVNYGDPNDPTMRYYVIVTAPSTSWEDNDALDTGHTYYYQVQAVNAAGEGRVSSLSQQAYTSTPTTPPPASNPFLGTWRNVSDSLDTFVFTDHSATHYYRDYDPGTGSYTFSGNRATITLSYDGGLTTWPYIADITGPNSLRMTYHSGDHDDFTRQ
jgi:hypothetical protein